MYPEGFAPDLAGPGRRKNGTGKAGTALFAAWVCQIGVEGRNPERLGGGARKKERVFRRCLVPRLSRMGLGPGSRLSQPLGAVLLPKPRFGLLKVHLEIEDNLGAS